MKSNKNREHIEIRESINKLRKIINTIEDNIYIPKESILLNLSIEMDLTIEAIRKIFRLHCPLDMGLGKYIVERKRTETIKAIKNVKNIDIVDMKIREISQCSRGYFDRMLYQGYNVRIADLMYDKDLHIPYVQKLDIDAIEANMISIVNNIYDLVENGIIHANLKRTKINIK